MESLNNSGVLADSTAIHSLPTSNSLITTQRADFGGLGEFVVDSARIAPKKVSAPIIKTVPYVPENDTISHPNYDVLTGDFVISRDESMASQLRINPISPLTESDKEQQQITAVKPQEMPAVARPAEKPVLVESPAEAEVAVVAQDTAESTADSEAYADALQTIDTVEVSADTVAVVADSTSTDTVQLVAKPRQQVFKEKEGKPIVRRTNNFALNKSFEETDWMIGVVIFSFVLFAWTRMIYGKFVGMVTQSAVNFYTARRVYEESNVIRVRVFLLLNILFYVNISLFASQCISFFDVDIAGISSFKWFGICGLAFFAIYTVKTLVLKILDFIFDTKTFGSYNFTIYLYNKMYGLLLLPLIAVIPFVPDFVAEKLIWAGVILFIFFYVSTLFRGLRICIKNRVSVFYLFFYLCALEILPLLTIYKYILDYVL